MADIKHLTRDTAREEYFYRMGFQEGFRTARAAEDHYGWDSPIERALAVTTQNAREQVDE